MSTMESMMPFTQSMGIKVVTTTPEKVVGQLEVRADLCTTGEILHGGAIMAFADSLGAIAAFLNLPDGAAGTTTIESKTNFLGAAKIGSTVTGTTTAVKVGRRLSVWTTKITDNDQRDIAVVTQTQLVL